MLLLQINLLLAQTTQERNLTLLYLALFILVLGMLVLDNHVKAWKSAALKWFIYTLLIIVLVVFIILLVTRSNN